jgi:hypothetical protein
MSERIPRTNLTHHTYICKVSDPLYPEKGTAVYPNIRAVSETHADRQARDGWCSLLGVQAELYNRLEVEIQRVP